MNSRTVDHVKICNHAGEYPQTLDADEFAALRIAVRDRVNSDDITQMEADVMEDVLEKLDYFELPTDREVDQ